MEIIKIHGDVFKEVSNPQIPQQFHCVISDPPYGNIVNEKWDKVKVSQTQFADWLVDYTKLWTTNLVEGGSFWIWGGTGTPLFRPFFQYAATVEEATGLKIQSVITWSKKRAYGVQNNFLYTREELLWLVKGDKPRLFNIPLLDEERGYDGFNKKYSAKSKYKRRTMVWTDITELFNGKIHPTQKPSALSKIMIEATTNENDWVIDLFSGSGSTRKAAKDSNRNVVSIEMDEKYLGIDEDTIK